MNIPTIPAEYVLIDLKMKPESAPRLPINHGILSAQVFQRDESGLTVVKNIEEKSGHLEAPFPIPSFSATSNHPEPTNPEQLCESLIPELEEMQEPTKYLVAKGHFPEDRQNLGLPSQGLYAGDILMSTVKHIVGIHSEYLYISASISVAAAYFEDVHLNSALMLYDGAPKIWVIISFRSTRRFESFLARWYGLKPKCFQFVRHFFILVRPSLLREWNIDFEVVRQRAGFLMLVTNGAYHFVINEGANLAGAFNYATSTWVADALYEDCKDSCNSTKPIKASDFASFTFRPFDGDVSDVAVKRTRSHKKIVPDSNRVNGRPVSSPTKKRMPTRPAEKKSPIFPNLKPPFREGKPTNLTLPRSEAARITRSSGGLPFVEAAPRPSS